MTDDTEHVEINNAKEEISEIVDKCNKCGLCKEFDSIFKINREEASCSRGLCILLAKGSFDKKLFDYPLDGSCKSSCPFNIDLDSAIRKARKILNLKGKENPKNKELLQKILDKENPFEED